MSKTKSLSLERETVPSHKLSACTSEVCLFHKDKSKIRSAQVKRHITELGKLLGNPYKRLFADVIDEIENLESLPHAHTVYEKIFTAVDLGINTFKEMKKFTRIRPDRLQYHLHLLVEAKQLELVPQGGKTEMARGTRKMLYRRPEDEKTVTILTIDDF